MFREATTTQAPRKLIARGFGVNLMRTHSSAGVVLAIAKDGVIGEIGCANMRVIDHESEHDRRCREYQERYDDLVRQIGSHLTSDERRELDRAIDDVKQAWWSEKCRGGNGSAVLQMLKVDSSQLWTGA